ncbi:MAG: uroporphyrinogen-III synthase [Chromatiales bacterium]|nr:uroporphyrinogen-III synthase [Chromatiales bacterium]
MTNYDDIDLAGLGVLVTRPEAQGRQLCTAIEGLGGRAECIPALDIVGPADDVTKKLAKIKLSKYDCVIFVSRNAVDWAQKIFPDLREQLNGPNIAAVGTGTADALNRLGVGVDICPETRQSSEGLLELEPLYDVLDRKIAIVRGEGGREILRDELTDRGADVDYIEVYRRAQPDMDIGNLLDRWKEDVQVVVMTSVESLENFLRMLGRNGVRMLRQTPMVTAGERITAAAEKAGIETVMTAAGASDEAILGALIELADSDEDDDG